jgi:hypothetical protein
MLQDVIITDDNRIIQFHESRGGKERGEPPAISAKELAKLYPDNW